MDAYILAGEFIKFVLSIPLLIIEFFAFLPPKHKNFNSLRQLPFIHFVEKGWTSECGHFVLDQNIELRIYGDFRPMKEVIIFFHGNAGDLLTTMLKCDLLCKTFDKPLFVIEYPGYCSDIGNRPNIKDTLDRCLKSYQYILFKYNVHPQNITFIAQSLGTGIALQVLAEHKIRIGRLVLISPYLSLISVVSTWLGSVLWFVDQLKSYENIKKVSCQTLIIHSHDDQLIRFHHGAILNELVPDEFRQEVHELFGAAHNETFTPTYNSEVLQVIKEFINPFSQN